MLYNGVEDKLFCELLLKSNNNGRKHENRIKRSMLLTIKEGFQYFGVFFFVFYLS